MSEAPLHHLLCTGNLSLFITLEPRVECGCIMSLEYKPSSGPLLISVKQSFLRGVLLEDNGAGLPPERQVGAHRHLKVPRRDLRVWGLGFGVLGLGFGVLGLGFGVERLGSRV